MRMKHSRITAADIRPIAELRLSRAAWSSTGNRDIFHPSHILIPLSWHAPEG